MKKELVLPSHYKELLEMQRALDNSIYFMRSCRKAIGKFDELSRSMEQSYHRRKFEIYHFRQMITIAPDFFTYKWEKPNAFTAPVLFIDFKRDES